MLIYHKWLREEERFPIQSPDNLLLRRQATVDRGAAGQAEIASLFEEIWNLIKPSFDSIKRQDHYSSNFSWKYLVYIITKFLRPSLIWTLINGFSLTWAWTSECHMTCDHLVSPGWQCCEPDAPWSSTCWTPWPRAWGWSCPPPRSPRTRTPPGQRSSPRESRGNCYPTG